MFSARLVLASIACCLTSLTLGAMPETPSGEVEALKSIVEALGKTDWNFSNIDPCGSNYSRQNVDTTTNNFASYIICNTSNDNTTYHVVGIYLKRQNLTGTLPLVLDGLPYLDHIDLTLNLIEGQIPSSWGFTHLTKIDLLGNRLTGPIPEELANLSNLTGLVIEQNNLSGPLPEALGKLTKIERLHLNSNKFTGGLPQSFASLTALKEFWISDNNFTGTIPDFIQHWNDLELLYIQGSGLSGPIPSGIGALQNITDLRISDLDGPEQTIPSLVNLTNLEILILRSCNLIGGLPDYLGELQKLKQLDVSFNGLSGEIQASLSALSSLDYLYLTGNQFTGPVPNWTADVKKAVDASYNSFTDTAGISTVDGCQSKVGNLNFFNSTSRSNNSGIVSCLGTPQCTEPKNSVHIDCGGPGIQINTTSFDADKYNAQGFTCCAFSGNNWALSTTGNFLDASDQVYIVNNLSQPSISDQEAELYSTARLSPISLTYYAYCLENGTYSVDLHFAEIEFTDGQNYSSLGRRMFDVYIQGIRKLKDFNIEDAAGGVGKPIVQNFTENVTDGTLEIHLRWAGKGTTSIPVKGVYGPLISAISVYDPNYTPPSDGGGISQDRGGISTAGVVGIVAGAAFAIFLILGILWWNGCLRRQSTLERDLKGIELHTSSFSLRKIKAATNNFNAANKIGEGGFGPVYKGTLEDGTVIAVKQLSAKSSQGNREFVTEIGMISAVQHPHLVKLYGCCIEGNQLMLIYEYLENNSLHRALFGPEEAQLKLDWPTRQKICIGIARGLAYLHEESRLKIVHRDIKSTNVLLDKNLNPKISDFGMAKLHEEDKTHISTRIAGTVGYMAPEYALHGYLTDKADVYSFGIVALEIVSGRCNAKNRSKEESFFLLDWAQMLKEKGQLLDIVDPKIGSDCNIEEVTVMINVALLCTNPTAAERPSMSSVVSMLEGRADVQEFVGNSSLSTNDSNMDTIKMLRWQIEQNDAGSSQTKNVLADGPWTSSSTSAADLYPVNLSSGYLQNRDPKN